jgi:hypothetical protein
MVETRKKKRTINGREFAQDIRSGMSDSELSQKYGLTCSDLDRVLGYLVDAGLITSEQLETRQLIADSQVIRAFVESCEGSRVVDWFVSKLKLRSWRLHFNWCGEVTEQDKQRIFWFDKPAWDYDSPIFIKGRTAFSPFSDSFLWLMAR